MPIARISPAEFDHSLRCPSCQHQIKAEEIVRPRFDYVLCPKCGVEFIPTMHVL